MQARSRQNKVIWFLWCDWMPCSNRCHQSECCRGGWTLLWGISPGISWMWGDSSTPEANQRYLRNHSKASEMILWRIFQVLVGIPLGLLCLAILVSETIRCSRIIWAMIKGDQEIVNDLWLWDTTLTLKSRKDHC